MWIGIEILTFPGISVRINKTWKVIFLITTKNPGTAGSFFTLVASWCKWFKFLTILRMELEPCAGLWCAAAAQALAQLKKWGHEVTTSTFLLVQVAKCKECTISFSSSKTNPFLDYTQAHYTAAENTKCPTQIWDKFYFCNVKCQAYQGTVHKPRFF